ncbi:MAG: hypothetical protein AABY22_32075 [Nanoarchaeota archaeon]
MTEAWKQIIEKKAQILILQKEINSLKSKAVLELRKLGYSHDKICGIIGIGKVNSIKYASVNKNEQVRNNDLKK